VDAVAALGQRVADLLGGAPGHVLRRYAGADRVEQPQDDPVHASLGGGQLDEPGRGQLGHAVGAHGARAVALARRPPALDDAVLGRRAQGYQPRPPSGPPLRDRLRTLDQRRDRGGVSARQVDRRTGQPPRAVDHGVDPGAGEQLRELPGCAGRQVVLHPRQASRGRPATGRDDLGDPFVGGQRAAHLLAQETRGAEHEHPHAGALARTFGSSSGRSSSNRWFASS
jgi:hypothetical protein